jgi:zinc D-Ala-D-Ala carboxypeptidase
MMYFTLSEFDCPCCKLHPMSPLFLAQLEKAREIAGVPFVITSGYRCPKHNAEVGSTSKNHTSGMAADIKTADGPTRGKVLKGLYRAGFTRIGISFEKGFVHADTMDDVESCWHY